MGTGKTERGGEEERRGEGRREERRGEERIGPATKSSGLQNEDRKSKPT